MSCGLITPRRAGHAVLIDLLHDLRDLGGRACCKPGWARAGASASTFSGPVALIEHFAASCSTVSKSAGLAWTMRALSRASGTMSTLAGREAAAATAAAQEQVAHESAADVAQGVAGEVADDAAVFAAGRAAENRGQHFGNRRGLGVLQVEDGVLAAGGRVVAGDGGEQVFQLVECFEVVGGDERAAGAGGDDDRAPRGCEVGSGCAGWVAGSWRLWAIAVGARRRSIWRRCCGVSNCSAANRKTARSLACSRSLSTGGASWFGGAAGCARCARAIC